MIQFKRFLRVCVIAAICGAGVSAADAVTTQQWIQDSQADFNAGKLEDVVATNLGDLKLSRAVHTILEQDPQVSAVYAVIEAPDGTIYAATGPNGVLLKVVDGKVQTVVTIEDAVNLTSLALDAKGRLLIGTSGEEGRVYRLDDPAKKPVLLFSYRNVQYVWAMSVTPDGLLYVATGPQGTLFEVNQRGGVRTVLKTDELNLLSMASDGGDTLYIGTHPNGLVYKFNRKTGKTFIIYDAAETEVSSLAIDAQGNLYAGTAQALESGDDDESSAPQMQMGRLRPMYGQAIPSTTPDLPVQPVPEPDPGEPRPIPRQGHDDDIQADHQAKHQTNAAREQADQTNEAAAQDHTPQAMDHGAEAGLEPQTVVAPSTTSAPAGGTPFMAASGPAESNAVYRITPQGFVTEIFRKDVTVLSLLAEHGKLLVGTGTKGVVYEVDPLADEVSKVAQVDPSDVLSLYRSKQGTIYLGLANEGSIATLGGRYASRGTYTSAVLDAVQVSQLGMMQLRGTLEEGTTLTIQTRSGNVEEPSERTWSPWTEEKPATEFVKITSPSARFFQYRLIFTSSRDKQTPVVDRVTTAYQWPNIAPRIDGVAAVREGQSATDGEDDSHYDADDLSQQSGQCQIQWHASDANSDKLLYTLYLRRGTTGPWIILHEPTQETGYLWQTKRMADGVYYVKVVASDELSNVPGEQLSSSRVSEPIRVDNTPPVIGDLKWQKHPQSVKVAFRVVDQMSTVKGIAYLVDGAEHWQKVLPVDKIADSPDESVSFVIDHLTPGTHSLTIRAVDSHGNVAYETLVVTAGDQSK